ncbi:S41 family peptidase [Marinigracilibium pacificum]|uniref:S41 family peptidase n=1 Tax=Marinigracilibium pacificum TaxID=2729599 RepID=A0A848IZ32_9BACT|nr:S41 family peptidase [Marinigracilibium pacificum]NMM47259.1 S41 family peptidase [Marinigracilibium pacificum]
MKKKVKYLLFTVLLLAVGLVSFRPNNTYFEIQKNLDIFATLYKELNTYYVDEITPGTAIKTGIDAMLSSLDPYTNYIPEEAIEEYRTQTTGQYGGIGAVVGNRDGKSIIIMPFEESPATTAGLKAGDVILAVNGVNIEGKSHDQVSTLLKGEIGKMITLKINRYGVDKPFDVDVERQKIKVENVPYFGMINSSVGFVKLTDFTEGAGREVRAAVETLRDRGAESVILDLRGNPGGLLNEAVNVASVFIPKFSEVVTTKGRIEEWNQTYKTLDMPVDIEMPVAVLTDNMSASASEIVAGVIQDYDRGVLVGARTFGKGLVQTTRRLSYNGQLKITTAKYYIPSGRCIQAIDYSHRNSDGTPGTIPDSLRQAFKTENGRIVYDGKGIKPDLLVEEESYAPITRSLLEKSLLFDYATEYSYKNPEVKNPVSFKLSDSEYQDFSNWLKTKEYDYVTGVEKSIDELKFYAQKERYYEAISSELKDLEKLVIHNKEADLQTFKPQIKELLEKEIVSRSTFQRGAIEAEFDNDPQVIAAVKILGNTKAYSEILQGNK